MSAIWGAIQLENKEISSEILEKMEKPYHKYSIDRYEKKIGSSVHMGCGIQYFNKESRNEQLPIFRNNIYFDADVVLDNRKELLIKLNITESEGKLLTDGEILFRMIKEYGEACLNDILGAYTFVYYDLEEGTARLVCDAVGNRSLYYKIDNGVLYYSSLFEGINSVCLSELEDEWFVDFLAMDFLINCVDEEMTPYKEIKRVPTASVVKITTNKVEKFRYWNPSDVIKIKKYKNDEEIEKEFLKLWREAVRGVIRTDEEVAILLSGGLDSTAVASEAAPYLKEQGKILYSYTSVPLDEFDSTDRNRTDDETEDVLKSIEYYQNIEPEFLKMNGVNAWNGYDEQMEIAEMPYKANQNALWMQEACNKARKKGARLLLTGAYGNNSISFSGLRSYGNHLFKTFRWIKLNKFLSDYKRTIGISKKKALRGIVKDTFSKESIPKNLYGGSFVNRQKAEEYGTDRILKEIFRKSISSTKDCKEWNNLRVDWVAMRQIGELNMRKSLYSGLLIRDPSIDKRVIEFCLSLPYEQFVKDGIDRRLVRYYMRNQIPEHINRFDKRGRQGADNKFRIELDWDNIYINLVEGYKDNIDSQIVDIQKILNELSDKSCVFEYNALDVDRQIYTLKTLEYYKNHKVVTIIDR